MDSKIESVLAAYESREAEESKIMEKLGPGSLAIRDDFLIPIGRDTGLLLNHLIKTNGFKAILEVGTSYGNGAIWLGEAARATGGKVTTLEISQKKVDYARTMASKAGLENYIEFVVGDALASIIALPGPFDFVLIDLWKELYVPVFDAVCEKLSPGGLIAADNIIYPPYVQEDALAYRRHVRTKPGISSILLKTGAGVELSQKIVLS